MARLKQTAQVWKALSGPQKARLVGGFLSTVGILAMTLGCIFDSHWRARMIADFWPLDASRIAPNVVASLVQAMLLAVILYVIWPPFRKWANEIPKTIVRDHKRQLDAQSEDLKRHHESELSVLHAKLDAHHEDVIALHQHLKTGKYDEPVKVTRAKKKP